LFNIHIKNVKNEEKNVNFTYLRNSGVILKHEKMIYNTVYLRFVLILKKQQKNEEFFKFFVVSSKNCRTFAKKIKNSIKINRKNKSYGQRHFI